MKQKAFEEENIDWTAKTLLAEYGLRASEVASERAIEHIEAFEFEGALLWSKIAKAAGRLQRQSLIREQSSETAVSSALRLIRRIRFRLPWRS